MAIIHFQLPFHSAIDRTGDTRVNYRGETVPVDYEPYYVSYVGGYGELDSLDIMYVTKDMLLRFKEELEKATRWVEYQLYLQEEKEAK